ncbi:LysR family transcriptional regulator [Paracoccus sp. (in: a-proteobacteria)]|uniref:LysR family transcriptional regulator n=1 Tax=Paracoccus sp. TaxID=267 RepID=UPI002899DFC9|nr:LysR family transcriptional regulator [Paracoccus sp. (in: a-proteobacteria)]
MINADLFNDFLSLVQSRNFSTTARVRGMSQSTLSRRIAQLESYIGAELFDRAIQPVALTEAGEALLPQAQDILEKMRDIQAIGHPEVRRHHEQCTMVALSTLAINYFPSWLSRLGTTENWRVNLLNTEPLFAANVRNFLRGQADFLLTFGLDHVPDLHALRHHSYIVLGTDHGYPVTIPDAQGRPMWSLNGPRPVNYCAYTKGSFYQQALSPIVAELGGALHKVRDNSMAAVLYSMVRQGHGMTWLPNLLIKDDLRSGALVLAGGPEFALEKEIRLYRSHNMNRYAQRFWSQAAEGHKICRRVMRVA